MTGVRETIIVSMPFTYEMEVVVGRSRKPSVVHVVDGVPVRIPVLQDLDAKVVLKKLKRYGDEHEFDMRTFDGRLYGLLSDAAFVVDDLAQAPKTDLFPVERSQETSSYGRMRTTGLGMGIDAFAAGMRAVSDGDVFLDAASFPLPLIQHKSMRRSDGTRRDRLGTNLRIERDDREASSDRQGAIASTAFIVVDGKVYAEESDPCWLVTANIDASSKSISAGVELRRHHEAHHGFWPASCAIGLPFRLNERQEATKLRDRFSREYEHNEKWEIDETHPWKGEVEEPVARRWAEMLVLHMEEYGQSFLKGSNEFLTAFMALRDAAKTERVGLRDVAEKVDHVLRLVRDEKAMPTDHANRMTTMSRPAWERIKMLGLEDAGAIDGGDARQLASISL